MKTFSSSRFCLVAALGLLMACSSTNNNDVSKAPKSDDLLELLTGFGESLSKRNYAKAVDFMVPEEKAMMMEGGSVPVEKQRMLLALPLQRLIRNPSIRVEDGHIAGIYNLLPNLRQGENSPMASESSEGEGNGPIATSEENSTVDSQGPMASDDQSGDQDEETAAAPAPNSDDPRLKETVNKFFSAVNRKNWSGALALMNEDERKFLLDEKGRIKESSKQRLSQMDQKNREALVLMDGKLTGVTLLLPAN